MPTEYAVKLMENRENKFTHESKKDIPTVKTVIIESYDGVFVI